MSNIFDELAAEQKKKVLPRGNIFDQLEREKPQRVQVVRDPSIDEQGPLAEFAGSGRTPPPVAGSRDIPKTAPVPAEAVEAMSAAERVARIFSQNVTSGVASPLGGLVDAASFVLNIGPNVVNTALDAVGFPESQIQRMTTIDKPFLGSEHIEELRHGLQGTVQPEGKLEKFAADFGQGLGAGVVPGGALARAGVQAGSKVVGHGKTLLQEITRQMAKHPQATAVGEIGANIGAGAGGAASEAISPDSPNLRIAAEMLGAVLGGFGGAAGTIKRGKIPIEDVGMGAVPDPRAPQPQIPEGAQTLNYGPELEIPPPRRPPRRPPGPDDDGGGGSGITTYPPPGERPPGPVDLPEAGPVPPAGGRPPKPSPGQPETPPAQTPPPRPKPNVFDDIAISEGEPIKGVVGRETVIKTPNREFRSVYKVVEVDSLQPSHDPMTFAENPRFPKGVQPRDYLRDKAAQSAVSGKDKPFDFSFILNDTPTAVDGPPQSMKTGVVLGGTNRAMRMARVYAEGRGDIIKNPLMEQAGKYGMTADEIRNMKRPVPVRELLDDIPDARAAAAIADDLNKPMTRSLSEFESAVAAGRRISQETLDSVSASLNEMGQGATIRGFLGEKGGQRLVQRLREDGVITQAEITRFTDRQTGLLSPAGKDYIERALLGTVIQNAALLENAPKISVQKIAGSLAQIARLRTRGKPWDISKKLENALETHTVAKSRGISVVDFLTPAQGNIFDTEAVDPITAAIARTVAQKKQTAVKNAFTEFATAATQDVKRQGRLEIAPPVEAHDAFNHAFKTKLTAQQYADALETEFVPVKGVASAPRRAPRGGMVAPDEPPKPPPRGRTEKELGPRFGEAVGEVDPKTGRKLARDFFETPEQKRERLEVESPGRGRAKPPETAASEPQLPGDRATPSQAARLAIKVGDKTPDGSTPLMRAGERIGRVTREGPDFVARNAAGQEIAREKSVFSAIDRAREALAAPSPGPRAPRGGMAAPPSEPPGPPPGIARPESAGKRSGDEVVEAARYITRTQETPPRSITERIREKLGDGKALNKAQEMLTTHLAPIARLERAIYRIAGKALPRLDMARKFEQIAGATVAAENDYGRFVREVIKPIRKQMDDWHSWVFLERTQQRLITDQKRKRVGDLNLREVQDGLAALRAQVGDKTWALFQKQGKLWNKWGHRALKMQHEAGYLSKDAYERILKENDFYAPFKLMRYMEENTGSFGAGRIEGSDKLIKYIVGIDDLDFTLANMSQEMASMLYRSRLMSEKNARMVAFGQMRKMLPPDTGKGTPLISEVDPTRYYQIHYEPAEQVLYQMAQQQAAAAGSYAKAQPIEQSLTKVGKIIDLARKHGVEVSFKNMARAFGKATIGGAEGGGRMRLRAFTSEVAIHESAHLFDLPLKDSAGNVIRRSKTVFGKERSVVQRISSDINDRDLHFAITGKKLQVGKRSVFQEELNKLVNFTGLGGDDAYRNSAVERWAEFLNLYIHNPKMARSLAPEWTSHFEKAILPNAKVQRLVKNLAGFIQEIDKLPNILSPLKEMDNQNYLEIALRTALPDEKHIGVAPGVVRQGSREFGKKPPKGFDLVQYYEDGKLVTLQIPEEVARLLQGTSIETANIIGRMAGMAGGVAKAGATALNIAFQTGNLPIDQWRATFLSKYGIKNVEEAIRWPFDLIYNVYSAMGANVIGQPNEMYSAAAQLGVFNSSLQRQFTPELWAPKAVRAAKGIPAEAGRHLKNVITSPAKMSNALEETSKISGVRRFLRREGIDLKKLEEMNFMERIEWANEAITEIRNYSGSPDFARKGTLSKGHGMLTLDLLFLFYNAATQGISQDLARVVGQSEGGGRAAVRAWTALTATVGIPALTLYAVNHSEDEVTLTGPEGPWKTTRAAEYGKVPDWERENYFMIPKNTYFINDKGERVADYWKIQRRELVKTYSNVLDSALDFARDRDAAGLKEMLITFVENNSPINVSAEPGEPIFSLQRLESIISSSNPIIKTPVELGTGRDTFRKRPTEPAFIAGVRTRDLPPEERYTQFTNENIKSLGKLLKVSPLKINQAMSSITGGGLTQFFPSQPGKGRTPHLGKPLVGAVLRRFMRSEFVRDSEDLDHIQEAIQRQGVERANLYRNAEAAHLSMRTMSPPERVRTMSRIRSESPKLADKIADLFAKQQLGLSVGDRMVNQLGVTNGERARHMARTLEGKTPEEQLRLRRDWVKKKLLSDRVARQLDILMRQSGGTDGSED